MSDVTNQSLNPAAFSQQTNYDPNNPNEIIYRNNSAAYNNDNLNSDRNAAYLLSDPSLSLQSNGSFLHNNNTYKPDFAIKPNTTAAKMGNTNLAQAALAQSYQGPQSLATSSGIRGQQMGNLQAQAQMAMGQGPSVAATQGLQGQQSNLQDQLSAMANTRGGVNGNLMHQAYANQALNQSMGIGNQAAMARGQEIAQLQGAYGGNLQAARGQDIAIGAQNAQLQMQNAARQNQLSQYNTGQNNAFTLQQGQINQQQAMTNAQMQDASRARQLQIAMANQGQEQSLNDLDQQRRLASLGAMQGIEFELPLVDDGAGGLVTRNRISPTVLASAGMPHGALPQGSYPLDLTAKGGAGSLGSPKFAEAQDGAKKAMRPG